MNIEPQTCPTCRGAGVVDTSFPQYLEWHDVTNDWKRKPLPNNEQVANTLMHSYEVHAT